MKRKKEQRKPIASSRREIIKIEAGINTIDDRKLTENPRIKELAFEKVNKICKPFTRLSRKE